MIRSAIKIIIASGVFFASCMSVQAEETVGGFIVIRNVNVFDGVNEKLATDVDVLIEGNLVKSIGTSLNAPVDSIVIEGGGRTLMPGLHDMHTHIAIFRQVTESRNDLSPFTVGAIAAKRVEGMLMNGFTTIMDVGGPAIFVRNLVDAGTFVGPRIFSAEALVTQTSGHGDFRNANDSHPNNPDGARHGFEESHSCIADGKTEVRRCVRSNFRRGATHIKIMTGGGVSSQFDPLHSIQSSPEEIQAAVEAAANWHTFVSAHAFTDESVIMSVENGVKYIIHAPMITEETAKLMAREGAIMGPTLAPVFSVPREVLQKMLTPASFKKFLQVAESYPNAMRYAVKHDVKMVYGTDLLAPPYETVDMDDSAVMEFIQLTQYMSPFEALKTATSNARDLIKMTGPNNPYQEGPTGVVEVGAYADLLLVDGNPLENIEVMTDPDNNFRIIMKDGVIYKNTL